MLSLPNTSATVRPTDARGHRLLIAALAITALTYAGTLRFGFVYDDGNQIYFNSAITSWKYLPTYFAAHSWKFMLPDWAGSYYRPIFMSWLLVNRMIFGLHPAAWHATTVLLHLVATWMAFVVARQLLCDGTQAGFVALLFGLHPIHIESVAWISGLTDPLMSIFVFAAFWAWIRGRLAPSQKRWPWWAAFFYLAGCLSKEAAFFLPVMILAYEILWRDKESRSKRFTASCFALLPIWLTAALYLVVRAIALRGLIHAVGVSRTQLLLSVPVFLWDYMRLLVWPVNLSLFYATPLVTSAAQPRFWLHTLAWLAFTLVAWRIGRKSPVVGFSLLWIFVFLLPAIIGLPAFPYGDWVHDRYLYLPAFGLCLLLVHTLANLPSQRQIFGSSATPLLIVVLLSASMAYATAWQQQYWSSSLLIFARSTNVQPNSAWAKQKLASVLLFKGDRPNARQLYEQSRMLDPDNFQTLAALAGLAYDDGNYSEAGQYYARALKVDSSDANTHLLLGVCEYRMGDLTRAEQAFRAAIERNTNLAHAHYWLGVALEQRGSPDEARREYSEELRRYPNTDTDARQRLANLQAGKLIPEH
jgi:protein O-mannosyl-transferase